MTHLANQIIAQSAADCGRMPDLPRFADVVKAAVPFEITDPVGTMAGMIASSPMSRLWEARRFARLPFRRCWVEWIGPAARFNPKGPQDDPGKESPPPARMGALVEAIDDTLQRGMITWAWSHKPQAAIAGGVNVAGICCTFDWTEHPQPVPGMLDMISPEMAAEHRRKTMAYIRSQHASKASNVSDADIERDMARFGSLPNPRMPLLWRRLQDIGPTSEPARRVIRGMWSDVVGEEPFVEALLVCMNSRNLVRVDPPDDMTRLNKARCRNHKPPLVALSRVNINLSRIARRSAGNGEDGGALRAHIVRGHFKMRQSGIFWWSPFVRGKVSGGDNLTRSYTVTV